MNLLGEPAPTFDDPIGLLRACHERILGHCLTLERLAEHLTQCGADNEARHAATRIRRYFLLAAPQHHADEEEDLFPWLLQQPEFPAVLRTSVKNLAAQHRQLEEQWQRLDQDLAVVEAGRMHALGLEPFIGMNRAHVTMENEEIFPIAEGMLDTGKRASIGATMARRRQAQ
ncbi:Hemerythrin HHE cation binding domain protein [Acidithiobacillus ferrivorans]|uniref:Cation-binding protein n=1 Tax=Acidithiobacillus ferrivorans TaxID=160808 RepID=A0A060UMD9_9PROT|nr:hemerythrin domain-containing protein [Acidithiobacillus ferrivorans]MBN6742746.1 hemerythrin domain-containing protein [Acidithiobacillus sp. MC6.1]OCB03001.1 cation-binding protein [Acidithiobacillus ferrivorans]QQD72292.1 hemerythrin domain-containing protein [Acidithiobacillus ferrivorans]CDQ09625.1 Hemerythrin HHE cation binding domain protein [Acidithiobacillus ferrivorans]SMH67131.1 Hemerythrin HHE cation binding domain protein [Acidithiobacillus ferrivorans]